MSEFGRPVIAIAGQPNAGKSTVFNQLTGGNARVANYPGVTVESRVGVWRRAGSLRDGTPLEGAPVVDIPGAYSLHAQSPEEGVAVATIAGTGGGPPAPDVLIDVVDVEHLERNLFLTLQLIELGRPLVVVLSMHDRFAARGGVVDPGRLSRALGVPVVVGGRDDAGTPERIARALDEALAAGPRGRVWRWSDDRVEAVVRSQAAGLAAEAGVAAGAADGIAHWLLGQSDADPVELATRVGVTAAQARAFRTGVVDALAAELGGDAPGAADLAVQVIEERYRWIERHALDGYTLPRRAVTTSDRIDAVVTHPVVGPLLFLATMGLTFQLMFAWSAPLIGLVEWLFGGLSDAVTAALPAGLLTDLLVQGVIAGVGGVVVFLPQVAILYLLLALLDTSGYLARAAFIMDRLMGRVGLHGKAFVPMLSSFACAVPGVAATRTIERRSDRLITILVAPLMTCSARLPVYTLLLGTFFGTGAVVAGVWSVAGLGMFALYLAGIAGAFLMAWIFRRTILPGARAPLVLELPPYHVPRAADVLREVGGRSASFLAEAGTVIVAATVLLWVVMTFPRSPAIEADFDARIAAIEAGAPEVPDANGGAVAALRRARNEAVLSNTIAGRVGDALQPVFAPLGFNTRITIGLVAALSAREVMVSALGVSYGLNADETEHSPTLRQALASDPTLTPAVAISLMVWFVFAFQCIATLGAVYRETRSWRWPAVLVTYQTALAWCTAFVAYRAALALGLG